MKKKVHGGQWRKRNSQKADAVGRIQITEDLTGNVKEIGF